MRMTVNCPFCGTGFVFRSEEKRQAWVANGRKDPIHAACKSEQKKLAAVALDKQDEKGRMKL